MAVTVEAANAPPPHDRARPLVQQRGRPRPPPVRSSAPRSPRADRPPRPPAVSATMPSPPPCVLAAAAAAARRPGCLAVSAPPGAIHSSNLRRSSCAACSVRFPVAGHVLPLMPTAAAAQADGHVVAVLTSGELRDLVAPHPVLDAGPPIASQIAETVRRTGRTWAGPGPEAAELFAGTLVDVTHDATLSKAQAFAPDLVVCDPLDYVGPTVAGVLDVAWATHGIAGAAVGSRPPSPPAPRLHRSVSGAAAGRR